MGEADQSATSEAAAPRTRSHGKLRRAAAALLDERDPAGITVTDLVKAAGVSRPTFYATYEDLSDAWADAAVLRLEEAFRGFDPFVDGPGGDDPAELAAVIGVVVRRLEPHVTFMRRIVEGPGGAMVLHRAISFLAERIAVAPGLRAGLAAGPLAPATAATAVAAALVWTAVTWAYDDERGPVAKLSEDLNILLSKFFDGGLGGAP